MKNLCDYMELEKITVVGMPKAIKIEQFNLFGKHLQELAKKEIPFNEELKKISSDLVETNRRIIVFKDNFISSSYSGSIKYEVRIYGARINDAHCSIGEKEFEYKI